MQAEACTVRLASLPPLLPALAMVNEEGSEPSVFASLFESYAQACRTGTNVDDDGAGDAFEVGRRWGRGAALLRAPS